MPHHNLLVVRSHQAMAPSTISPNLWNDKEDATRAYGGCDLEVASSVYGDLRPIGRRLRVIKLLSMAKIVGEGV